MLVVKRFLQKQCIDYIEIFSTVVKQTTIREILGLIVKKDLHLDHFVVKITFLHGDLEEENLHDAALSFQSTREGKKWCANFK